MPDVVFVLDEDLDPYRRDFTETLVHELRAQGLEVATTEVFPTPDPDRVTVAWEPLRHAEMFAAGPLCDALPRTVFLTYGLTQTEIDAHRRLLRRAGARFDLDPQSVFWMQAAGLPAQLLRPGYSAWRDRFEPDAERPLDVVFLGPRSDRVASLLRTCEERLGGLTLEVRHAERGVAGPDRFELLSRAKVALQIGAGEDSHFDWGAAVDAIHCGAVVVSESARGISHLVPGTHILAASGGGLPHVLVHALGDPALLGRLRRTAHERISSWFPLELSLGMFIRAVTDMTGRPDITDRSQEEEPNVDVPPGVEVPGVEVPSAA